MQAVLAHLTARFDTGCRIVYELLVSPRLRNAGCGNALQQSLKSTRKRHEYWQNAQYRQVETVALAAGFSRGRSALPPACDGCFRLTPV